MRQMYCLPWFPTPLPYRICRIPHRHRQCSKSLQKKLIALPENLEAERNLQRQEGT
jgi:hypothetical protein